MSIPRRRDLIGSNELEILVPARRQRFQLLPRAERNQRSSELPRDNLMAGSTWVQSVWEKRFQIVSRDELVVQFDQWEIVLFSDAAGSLSVWAHRFPSWLAILAKIETRWRRAKNWPHINGERFFR
jgi:hypothetical protein